MTTLTAEDRSSLRLVRTFPASRSRVFKAWTEPEELRKWWKLGEGWKLTAAEVNLKVGGDYRISLESTQGEPAHTVIGTFQEVKVPEKLVYTWTVEDPRLREEESRVTVEFHERGTSTEVVVTHDRLLQRESRQNTRMGWEQVLDGLAKLLASRP